jgi:hypothetical protein
VIAVALVFAVLFGLALIPAISDAVVLPTYYELLGIGDAVPWPLLVLRVAVPVGLYIVALLLGRGRPLSARVLLYATALAVAFALALGIVEFVGAIQPPLT